MPRMANVSAQTDYNVKITCLVMDGLGLWLFWLLGSAKYVKRQIFALRSVAIFVPLLANVACLFLFGNNSMYIYVSAILFLNSLFLLKNNKEETNEATDDNKRT